MNHGILIIGAGGNEDLRALRLAAHHVGIIVFDTHGQLAPEPPKLTAEMILKITSEVPTCCDFAKEPILSNREERKQRQPFYRGLKKYRKP